MNRSLSIAILSLSAIAHVHAQAQTQDRASLTLQQALDSTVALHPALGAQQQEVVSREGITRQIRGSFDRVYTGSAGQTYANQPGIGTDGRFTNSGVNTTSLDGSASKLYRNGITAGPVASLNRSRGNLSQPDGLTTSRLAFEVAVPFRRNTAFQIQAQESSSIIDTNAARLDLNQTASSLFAETALRYWTLRGALELVEVARGAEQRGRLFLSTTEDLIAADRIPRNDVNLVRANLAERAADRIAAEQNVAAARQQLAYAMGLRPEEMQSLADPTDSLPDVSTIPDVAAVQAAIARALERRTDYQASLRRIASAKALLPAAEDQLRPSLDLVLSTGYSGLKAGAAPTSAAVAFVRGVSGADASAGVRYQFAPANNAAQGRVAQALAAVKRAELESSDVARSIATSVSIAMQAVRNAALRLDRARESVSAYTEALAAERDKYTLGIGSLVDILTTEDRLTQALTVQTNVRLEYATELSRLRQATGTILAPDADLTSAPPRIDAQDFRRLP